tara:strand:+ start:357 stop:938 length:582 start_codon:yes stop_codon:yes gene_type:complete
MKKLIVIILFIIFSSASLKSEIKINPISEGSPDSKIHLIIYESLTCGHCANFHKNVYPDLKKDFIDNGLVKIEFRNFPLDMLALNASKIAHCRNDGKSKLLHLLYKNQKKWVVGETINEANENIKKIIEENGFDLDFNKCLNNKEIEDYILKDRVEGVKKFKIEATPTLIINNKKFDKALNYKNIKKFLEKLI